MITALQTKIYINNAIAEHLTKDAEALSLSHLHHGAKQKDVSKLKAVLLALADKHKKKAIELNRKALEKKNGTPKVSP